MHEGSGKVAKCRVHHHARGLVDHREFVVEVDDVEVDGLGLEHKLARRLRQHQRNLFARLYPVVRLNGQAVDANGSGLGRLLNAVARGFFEKIEQEFIYAKRLLARVSHKTMVNVEFLFGASALFELVVELDHCLISRVTWPESLRIRYSPAGRPRRSRFQG